MSKTFAALAAVTFMLASSAAFAQAAKVADSPKGKIYVDAKGMSLYTFDKDTRPGDTTGDGFLNGAWHLARP